MNYIGEQGYLDLLRDIMENGIDRDDRTGTGTRSVLGRQTRYDLADGFPLLTTKKMNIEVAVSELLWFLEGSGDERRLAEIRYSKDRSELTDKKTIWTANAKAPYWVDKATFDGDLGRVYGIQLRQWTNQYGETIDQVKNLVDGLKNDPYSRRHVLTWWNPGELQYMALPACHQLAQFYVANGKLSCMYTMRSNDYCCGKPVNDVSYALLTHMLAQVCGYEVGELVASTADTHVYFDHFDGANEQLSRIPKALPKLILDSSVKDIFDFKMEHFAIEDYDPYPAIKFPMAV